MERLLPFASMHIEEHKEYVSSNKPTNTIVLLLPYIPYVQGVMSTWHSMYIHHMLTKVDNNLKQDM